MDVTQLIATVVGIGHVSLPIIVPLIVDVIKRQIAALPKPVSRGRKRE